MIGERREVHFSSEPPKDKSVQLAKTSSLQGRPKQYAHRKQPIVKKGSWQQNDNWCGRRSRHLPPRGRQEELVIPSKSLIPSEGEKKKTVSLNHLLNFTVAPRDTVPYGSVISSTRRKSKSTPSFNKEQFLQANCQFVVKHSGDYSVHLADPDLLVEWDSIEQVRLFCHQIPSCPICLYPPGVAKITRCGHVYCWSCVLHYLSLSDKAWRKCPICYESIYKDDLKSVSTIMSSQQYTVGDTITMWLMSKQKDGTVVAPKSCLASKGLLPTIDDKIPTQFYKLLTATPDQVLNQIISVEKATLLSQLKSLSAEEESERCFIDCCLEELKKREKLITGAKAAYDHARDIDTVVTTSQNEPDPIPVILHVAKDDNFIEGPFEQAFSDAEDEMDSSTLDSSSCSHSSIDSEDFTKDKTEFHLSSAEQTDSFYTYFYQASDGQHLYLHPINAHCLVKEYGSLVAAPLEIKARIVEMEQFGMNYDTRSKYRYLSHLPVTCQFMLCELDLKPPLVSRNTLSHFAAQLHKRRQLRQKKKHKENQMKYKADNGNSSLPDLQHRQQISPEKFHNLLSLASSPPLSSHVNVATQLSPTAQEFVPGKTSHNVLPTAAVPLQASTPSFAQALSKGEKKVDVRFPAVKVTTPPKGPAIEVHSDEDEIVPTFQDSFVDALAQATENMQIASQGTSGKPGGSKTAKKGRKKMVLFSTGTQRRSN